MVLDTVKIYLDGTMLRFESDDPEFFTRATPTGRVDIVLQGNGFIFTDVVQETVICSVKDFDDVLDAGGSPYGVSQDAVFTALNAFSNFKTGGGGANPGDELIDRYFYSVNVTNADTYPVLVHTEPIPLDNSISFEVEYMAFRTDTTGLGRRASIARFGSNDGGVLSTPAQANTLVSSSYGVTASIVLNGSNYELQIDGAGGVLTYSFWITIRKTFE
jgi:hypothetical protein